MVGLAASLTNLAILMVDTGDLESAIAYLKETLEIDRRLGNVSGIADTLGNLAALTSEQGDLARAAALDAEALEIRQDLGDRLSVAYGLESIASTVARAGFPEQSARLFGAAERLREELAAPLPPSEHERYEKGLFVTRQAPPRRPSSRRGTPAVPVHLTTPSPRPCISHGRSLTLPLRRPDSARLFWQALCRDDQRIAPPHENPTAFQTSQLLRDLLGRYITAL